MKKKSILYRMYKMIKKTLTTMGIFACVIIACSCNEDRPSVVDPPANGDSEVYGTFRVSLIAPRESTPGYTSVLGRMYDGPTPTGIIWEETASSGDCRLLEPRIPFCDPACERDEVCVEDDECQPYPTAIGVGTVHVDGLDESFSMEPINNYYQPSGGTILPYPSFAEGDDITFRAEGSPAAPEFTVTGKGISPLAVVNDDITLDGESITLEWTPPKQQGSTTLTAVFDISYHGGTRGKIVCETPDDGSEDVAGFLVEELKALGISGFPKIEVTRKTRSTTESPIKVDIVVESLVTKMLSIPGIISCNSDADCPEGQYCAFDFRCRE
jgi:hypothetical protein